MLPFPLELPEAIAKAASHKELESISHMGVGWCLWLHVFLTADLVILTSVTWVQRINSD